MSNNTNSVEFDVVPCTDVAPETQAVADCKECAPKKKTVATRIFAVLLIAICAVVFFLPVQVLNGYVPTEMTLLTAITDLFGGKEVSKLFNVLPVFTDTAEVAGMLAGVAFYAFVAAIVFTVIFALIALISGKACALRTAAFFFATGFGTYAVCGYALPTIKETAIGFDFIVLGAAVAGALLYLVLGFARKGKKAFASLVQLVFSLVFAATIVLLLNGYTAEVTKAVENLGIDFALFVQVLVAVVWVDLLLGTIRLQAKKGLALDMIRYIVQLIVGAVLIYVAFVADAADMTPVIYAAVAAVVSLVQVIMCVVQLKSGKKKEEVEEPEAVEQPAPEPVPEYTVEEYAEAMPYDGGPVEGVEIAQEVNPTFEENPIEPVQVNTAGYDFYNSKSFDPFIAILNNEERNQFTELFILKYKGVMPEIPDYQVGGDNKEFFRKLFIYLGQYRDRVPDGLLAKIYQFAIRNA